MANLEIKLTRSLIGSKKGQIETAKSLGLTKVNKTFVLHDNEAVTIQF